MDSPSGSLQRWGFGGILFGVVRGGSAHVRPVCALAGGDGGAVVNEATAGRPRSH